MILLDTNYLIGALLAGSRESKQILDWLEQGEVLITAMPAWYEFLCGPVSEDQIKAVRSVLSEIAPLDEAQSGEAATFFNHSKFASNHIDTEAKPSESLSSADISECTSGATRNIFSVHPDDREPSKSVDYSLITYEELCRNPSPGD